MVQSIGDVCTTEPTVTALEAETSAVLDEDEVHSTSEIKDETPDEGPRRISLHIILNNRLLHFHIQ